MKKTLVFAYAILASLLLLAFSAGLHYGNNNVGIALVPGVFLFGGTFIFLSLIKRLDPEDTKGNFRKPQMLLPFALPRLHLTPPQRIVYK